MKNLPLVLLTTALVGYASQVHAATAVDMEYTFMIDGSDSIPSSDFSQQITAYQNILRDNFFDKYVASLPTKRIAMAGFQYGGTDASNAFQSITSWTLISSQADADNYANQFNGITKIGGLTPLGYAIEQAADQMFYNDFAGTTLVMDITSDGIDSPPLDLAIFPLDASDYARCAGDLTNCPFDQSIILPGGVNVLNSISPGSTTPDVFDLINYGTNRTGSTQNSFLYPDINSYESTLASKLATEIGTVSTSTPEPSVVIGLVGMGLLGIGSKWMGRRK